MNKSAIKNFSIWARNRLIQDAQFQAGLLGITENGITEPRQAGETQIIDIGGGQTNTIQGPAVAQRSYMAAEIRRRERDSSYATAYKYVMEEAAYTWFNRLIAIRFMEINEYLPSRVRVLSSPGGKAEPEIVSTPFDAGLEFTTQEEALIRQWKVDSRTVKSDVIFRLLFRKQCNALNAILPGLFSRTDSPGSYEELLLNISYADPDGVVRHLVDDVPAECFDISKGGQVEIIGWLYQYYNTEPKNEAFAKNGKITKEEIPAVTQLFTPDWIVRYMVENSLGRLWAEGHPEKNLQANWKYWLDEAEQEPEVSEKLAEIHREYANINPEEIKFLDPCMGSGHILFYAFDVLIQIYESAGWTRREAARSIVENNLYGLDIDKRAYQLAYFALMMKAREYDRRFLSRGIEPNVFRMVESGEAADFPLEDFGWTLSELERNTALLQLENLLDEMRNAKQLGSILKPAACDWDLLERLISAGIPLEQMDVYSLYYERVRDKIRDIIRVAKPLSMQYDVVVTNPPYMGSANMNPRLTEYIKKNYPDSKADLFAVFIERCLRFAKEKRFIGMITQHAWMFLSSFEKLRLKLRTVDTINMAHLGPRAFDEISGEVVQTTSFVMRRSHVAEYKGTYCRLVDGKSESEKAEILIRKKFFYEVRRDDFDFIPGSPVAYWASESIINAFRDGKPFIAYAKACSGLKTGDNDRFLRTWEEVSLSRISLNVSNARDARKSKKKWFPYNKGGETRKWYGNRELVVNFEEDGREIRKLKDAGVSIRITSYDFYFKEGITWNGLTTGDNSFRYCPAGAIFDSNKGPMFFHSNDTLLYYFLGLFSSKAAHFILKILNPSLSLQNGDMENFPVYLVNENKVSEIVHECVFLAKSDWDSFETSWDFRRHPLLPRRENDAGKGESV